MFREEAQETDGGDENYEENYSEQPVAKPQAKLPKKLLFKKKFVQAKNLVQKTIFSIAQKSRARIGKAKSKRKHSKDVGHATEEEHAQEDREDDGEIQGELTTEQLRIIKTLGDTNSSAADRKKTLREFGETITDLHSKLPTRMLKQRQGVGRSRWR